MNPENYYLFVSPSISRPEEFEGRSEILGSFDSLRPYSLSPSPTNQTVKDNSPANSNYSLVGQ